MTDDQMPGDVLIFDSGIVGATSALVLAEAGEPVTTVSALVVPP